MAETKKSPKKNRRVRRERRERRFLPDPTRTSVPAFVAALVGGLVLGAGVYGQWVREVPFEIAPYLVGVGGLLAVAALWLGDAGLVPVRVGDAGVALERRHEVVRVAWCDMKRVRVEGRQLTIDATSGGPVTIPIAAHPLAVSWIVSESARRVPEVVDVPRSLAEQLPAPGERDGEVLPVGEVQVAGRHCASSDKPISFERDARLCPNCAQVYHKDHVPKSCVTCGSEIAGRALPAA